MGGKFLKVFCSYECYVCCLYVCAEIWSRSLVADKGCLPGSELCTWRRFIRAGCSGYSLRPQNSCCFSQYWCHPSHGLLCGWFASSFSGDQNQSQRGASAAPAGAKEESGGQISAGARIGSSQIRWRKYSYSSILHICMIQGKHL